MLRTARFDREVAALRPFLVRYAAKLSGSQVRAEDIAQEAIARALASAHQFTEGTKLRAWLCMITLNVFRSDKRTSRLEVEDIDGIFAAAMARPADQLEITAFREVAARVAGLSAVQREAIQEIFMLGQTYSAAGRKLGVPTGTMKARVSRARDCLALAGLTAEMLAA